MTGWMRFNTLGGIAINAAGMGWAGTMWYHHGYAPWVGVFIALLPSFLISFWQVWEKLGDA